MFWTKAEEWRWWTATGDSGRSRAEYATELAIEKARQHKIAGVGVVRCSHIGRLGEYSTLAARAGIIALVTAGGFGVPPGAAPFGGLKAALSTNPISMGFPATKIPMVLMDFATTQVAAGKIRVAAEKGEQLPPGCILDTEGRPSTDPQDFFDGGTMQHFGAHKGYGLSVAVDLLGGALTGAPLYAETQIGKSIYGTSGTFIIAIDPEAFRPTRSVPFAVRRPHRTHQGHTAGTGCPGSTHPR